MPNLISQMRNGTPQQQVPQSQTDSVEQVRNLMNMVRASGNPQQYLANMISQNPQLAQMVKSGNLKELAQQMARARGIDLNNLIQQLTR